MQLKLLTLCQIMYGEREPVQNLVGYSNIHLQLMPKNYFIVQAILKNITMTMPF